MEAQVATRDLAFPCICISINVDVQSNAVVLLVALSILSIKPNDSSTECFPVNRHGQISSKTLASMISKQDQHRLG